MGNHEAERDALAARIADLASSGSHRIAVAESLTGGLLSNDLARAEGSSEWFVGGVVAYATQFKHDVLNVRPGPVVSEEAARDMASGAALLSRVSTAVAVTGQPDAVFDPGDADLAKKVKEVAGKERVQLAVDNIGGDLLPEWRVLHPGSVGEPQRSVLFAYRRHKSSPELRVDSRLKATLMPDGKVASLIHRRSRAASRCASKGACTLASLSKNTNTWRWILRGGVIVSRRASSG